MMAVALTVLLVLGAAAAGQPGDAGANADPLTAEERAWLDAHGPIRYAPDPDYPPFEFVRDDGTVEGVNIDFLNRISRNLDIEFEIVVYDNWTAVLEAKQAGDVDLLGSLAQTPERDVYMDFIGPYMQVGEVFYVTDPALESEQDLVGRKVAVVGSYAAADWLETNRPELTLVPVDDINAGLEALTTGEVDAFFENVPVTGYFIRQNSLNQVRILGEPLYYSPANWGVTKDDALLYSIISKGIDSIPLGEQTKVFEYWTGYDLGIAPATAAAPLFSPLALTVVGVAAAVGGAAGIWSWTLRRQVGRKTEALVQSRDEVRQAYDLLEQRVQERTQELQALTRLEENVQATLAGQTREHAATMRALHEQVSERHRVVMGPDAVRLATEANSGAWRIADLVADVGFALHDQPIAPRRVPLRPLFEDAAHRVGRAHGHHIDVVCDPDVAIDGERTLLRQAAYCIIRYAAAAGATHVDVGAQPLRIHFDGISRAIADDLSQDLDGDLALPTFARILHLHGADVHGVSDDDGASLTITWPVRDVSPAATDAA